MKPFCDFCTETCNKIKHGDKQVCPSCFEKMHAAFAENAKLRRCGTCRHFEILDYYSLCGLNRNEKGRADTCEMWEIGV